MTIEGEILILLINKKNGVDFSIDTLINTIFYVGAIQGVILTFFLFSVKSNVISNKLLGILTFSWAIILLVFALQKVGLYRIYPHLLRIFDHLVLTWFPLLFLSLKYLVSSHRRFETKDLLHFVPFAVSFLLHTGFFFKSVEEKLLLNQSTEGYYFVIDILIQEFVGLQGVVYSILSLILLGKYKKSVINFQSNIDSRVLEAYQLGVMISLAAWSVGIVAFHLKLFNIQIEIDLFIFVYLPFVFIIYLISILAIRSPEVFKLSEADMIEVASVKEKSNPKEYKSFDHGSNHKNNDLGLPDQDEFLYKINQRLKVMMDEKKPYLNPDLSLQDLATMLDVSRHQLSAVINNYSKVNFYEFVNTYRVEEVKRLMKNKENQKDKIMSLAYDAGFNSNASFYRIFKNTTGQTPTQYKNSIKQDQFG
jgi:AraC-like DNA-binding protein